MQWCDRLVVILFIDFMFLLQIIYLFISLKNKMCFSYVSISLTFTGMRTSRSLGSSHPFISTPHLAPSVGPPPTSSPPSSLLPPVPQGSRERARVRNCVGMAVCVIEGVGPLGASGELHEFVMSAMLAMAYWTGEEQRSLGKKRPTESDRDPGLPGSVRAATDPSLPSIDRLTPRDRHRFIHENSRQNCCYS